MNGIDLMLKPGLDVPTLPQHCGFGTQNLVVYRRTTVRKQLFRHSRGFVTVNNGPAFAFQLARYLIGSICPSPLHANRPPGKVDF